MTTNLFFLLAFLSVSVSSKRPVVLMHGIESHSENLADLANWVSTTFNRQVVNVELGDGDDYSTNTPMWEQISAFNDVITNTTELREGFDLIGISQGGLIGRGYVARYNNPPVANLITLVSPHGGVYDKNLGFIDFYMYPTLSFAGYWRDPTHLIRYKLLSTFLTEVNGEKPLKRNKYLQTLTNFAMVFSPNDEIIKPPSSGIFDTFNQDLTVMTLENNPIYTEDWIGLKLLNETGRLHNHQTNCTHVEHRMPICFPQLYPILSQYLSN